MYEDTPNKEEIDWFAERVREVYDYDRLKDCDKGYLYNQEFGVMNDEAIFKTIFPDSDTELSGAMRAVMYDDKEADRDPLTEAEVVRLQMLKKEAEIEIHRAYGHRMEIRREHRNRFANSIADAVGSLASLLR
jgi:hypothetical protein